jgi:hypothetical protein
MHAPHRSQPATAALARLLTAASRPVCFPRCSPTHLKHPTMADKRIGFIGAGQMAEALARGFIAKGVCKAEHVFATDPVQVGWRPPPATQPVQRSHSPRAVLVACGFGSLERAHQCLRPCRSARRCSAPLVPTPPTATSRWAGGQLPSSAVAASRLAGVCHAGQRNASRRAPATPTGPRLPPLA